MRRLPIPPEFSGHLERVEQAVRLRRGNLTRLAKVCGVSRQQASKWFGRRHKMPPANALLLAMRWAEEEIGIPPLRYLPSWCELRALARVMFRVSGKALAFARYANLDRRRVSDYFGERKGGCLIPDGRVALCLLMWLVEEREENSENLNFPLANQPDYWTALMAVCTGLEMLRGAREGLTSLVHEFLQPER